MSRLMLFRSDAISIIGKTSFSISKTFWLVKPAFCVIIALVISLLLASREIGVGLDDDNYIAYVISASELLDAQGLLLFFNEPIWLVINKGLQELVEPEDAVRVIVFAGAFLSGVGLSRISGWSVAALVLYFVFPLSLKNHVDHLRQGMALGVFLFFYSQKSFFSYGRFFAPFIHSSFWIVLVIDLMVRVIEKHSKSAKRLNSICVLGGSLVSVVFSFFLFAVAGVLGFRQAGQYSIGEIEGSGLGAILWVAILPLLLTIVTPASGGVFFGLIGFYLAGYFVNPVAPRVFENSFPFIFAADVRRRYKFVLGGLFVGMSVTFGFFSTDIYLRLLAAI